MKYRSLFFAALISLCSGAAHGDLPMAKKMSLRIQALTNIFENSTTEFQYGYIENIHDGRGYTAGRVGFTTATGDLVEVVEKYTKVAPNNVLQKYLPELHHLADTYSADTSKLRGFVKAWKTAGEDPLFKSIQDQCVDEFYFFPALEKAKTLGVKAPLIIALIYDTLVQHGDGDDLDGFESLASRTKDHLHGTPADGVDEKTWFFEFARVREKDLLNPSDQATAVEWRKSVGRVHCYLDLARKNSWDLKGKVHVNVFGFNGDLP